VVAQDGVAGAAGGLGCLRYFVGGTPLPPEALARWPQAIVRTATAPTATSRSQRRDGARRARLAQAPAGPVAIWAASCRPRPVPPKPNAPRGEREVVMAELAGGYRSFLPYLALLGLLAMMSAREGRGRRKNRGGGANR
jgi:hypothetical protein